MPSLRDSRLRGFHYYSFATLKKKSRDAGGIQLQRFFSTFPGGPPGLGLLLLRTSLGSTLIAYGLMWMLNKPPDSNWLLASALILGGLLLLVGFLTPFVSVVVCIGGLIGALSRFLTEPWEGPEIPILFMICAAASIVLLGPGAVSVDANLFGRREIIIPKRTI